MSCMVQKITNEALQNKNRNCNRERGKLFFGAKCLWIYEVLDCGRKLTFGKYSNMRWSRKEKYKTKVEEGVWGNGRDIDQQKKCWISDGKK